MGFRTHHLTGKEHLAAVTQFLQQIRLEGAYEGLYEAADLQWWWREEDGAPFPERQRYWLDEQGNTVACLLRHDGGDEWNNDFLWLPSARRAIDEELIPQVVAAICSSDKPSTLSVRADDTLLQKRLQAAGFVRDADALIQTELVQDPVQSALPPGFALRSRREDKREHHLIRRNGVEIERKLAECSLYRPELDLCIRDAAGTVAAYALFWMDDLTQVGMLEPLRTEREFRRLGLARHLIVEGIGRLRALGAKSIRVSYGTQNPAAATLYRQIGFVDRIQKFEYRRPSA